MNNNRKIQQVKQKISLSERVLRRDPEDSNSYNLLASRYAELEALDNSDYSSTIISYYDKAIERSDDEIMSTVYKIHKSEYLCKKQEYGEAFYILNNEISVDHIEYLQNDAQNSQHLHARNIAREILRAKAIKETINTRNNISDNLKLILDRICDKQGILKCTLTEEVYSEYAELIESFKDANLSPRAIMIKILKIDAIEKKADINSKNISALESWKELMGEKIINNSQKISEVLNKIQLLDKDSSTYAKDLSMTISDNQEIYNLIFELQTQVDGHEDQLTMTVNHEKFTEVCQLVTQNKALIVTVQEDLYIFRNEVNDKFSSAQESISSIFAKCSLMQDNAITQGDLASLITEVEKHGTTIYSLYKDIGNINDSAKTQFAEFTNQYKNHSSTIETIISELQALRDSSITHEERILKIRQKLSATQINMVSQIKYDNELLDNPEMLKSLLNKSSYDVNKLINLSSRVEESLMNSAIQDEDVDLLLGSIMSLDSELFLN